MLADAGNGYTWGWKLYTGKEKNRMESELAHHVVFDLVDDVRLLGKGYVIMIDNFYSSPALFHDLISREFHACGTDGKDPRGPSRGCLYCNSSERRFFSTHTEMPRLLHACNYIVCAILCQGCKKHATSL